ncbi:MAG TPA: hypothetical protein VEU30_00145 [Thermoanaerobaculia bacterium]|nr:hypothetical protein [Thermoanaerobaculia bacterium]
MPIILPNGLTSAEIRVLQEFRRMNAETMTVDAIKAIKHPAGGGEPPAVSLVAKGFLQGESGGFTLTQKAKDFLAIDPVPLYEETSSAAASAAESPDADGV